MAPVCSLAGMCKRADRKHRLVGPDEVNNSRGATFGACKLTKEAPPNLSADYLYPRQTAVVKQATETARNSVPSGGHSSSYLCQQDSVFAARDRFPGKLSKNGLRSSFLTIGKICDIIGTVRD